MHILTMGGVSVDLLFHLERLQPLQPVMLAQTFAAHPGGKAFNLALVTRRLFPATEVNVLAALGGEDDFFSQHLRRVLADEGLGTRYLCAYPGMAAPVVGIVTAPGQAGLEQITMAYEVTGRALNFANLDRVAWHTVDALIATCEINIEVALEAFARLKAANPHALTLLNTAPADHLAGKLPQLDLSQVDYWVLNWHEWATLIQPYTPPDSHDVTQLKTGLADLHTMTRIPNICLTMGENGCLWYTPQHVVHAPAFQIPVKNPVGAGDTLVAALVGNLLAQQPLREALRYASAAAACACQDNVAIGEHVTPATIAALLTEQGATWDEHFRVL